MAALQRLESTEREKTSIPRFEKNVDGPIWLNSFLSIFIPSCPLDLIDPAMLNHYVDKEVDVELKRGKKVVTEVVQGREIHDEAMTFNNRFQRKIIRRQLIASSIIILATVAIVWYLVNYNQSWVYNNNILTNHAFNIFSGVLVIMSFMSFGFVKNMDIFQLFHLNKWKDDTKEGKSPLVKGFILAAVTLLVLR